MRKILIFLIMIDFTLSDELPFIGKAWFNFGGGSGTNEYIIIKKNGDVVIGSCGLVSCDDNYRGKYKKIFKLYSDDSATYAFSADKVMMVSEKTGKVIRDCDKYGIQGLGNKPCIQTLNKDKNFYVPQGDKAILEDIKKFKLKAYAYKFITGRNASVHTINNIIVKTNSKGIKIYCLKNMNVCKTEQEVIDYALLQ